MDRREFLCVGMLAGAGALLGTSALGQRATRGFEEATVAELSAAMERGQLTSEALTNWYLNRIRAIDPKLGSIIEVNPDAITIARQRDRERRNRTVKGPLHGIPVVIKDNIDTADKMKTTAGSLALVDALPPKRDAFMVQKLREAGAVIIAKTNLSEWANFRDENSISGWSGRGGQTRNPYILDRNACGSSSGTGVAIAANLAAVGIGTETDGSILCPSSINGIVGLKPTVGLVSQSGIIPISATQDTAGPMTRSVADTAILMNAIVGRDRRDEKPEFASSELRPDYTGFLKLDGLRGARIGVARDYWGRSATVDKLTNAALEVLKRQGAELVDVRFPNIQKFGDAEFTVLKYEFKDGLERYLRERGSRHKTLSDLVKFNNDNAGRELKYFGQSIMEASARLGDQNSQEYKDALKTAKKYAVEEGIDEVMEKNRLHAIVAPSNGPTWLIDTVSGDCGSGYIGSSSMPAVAGYPNITVPAGFVKELPIGISFFGKPFTEGKLIQYAYAFEQATKARRKPKFLPTYA
jgi:amidase